MSVLSSKLSEPLWGLELDEIRVNSTRSGAHRVCDEQAVALVAVTVLFGPADETSYYEPHTITIESCNRPSPHDQVNMNGSNESGQLDTR